MVHPEQGKAPLTGARLSGVGVPGFPDVLHVPHHQIPSIEAVAASVGEDVARLDLSVLGEERDQRRGASALDADDVGGRLHDAATGSGSGAVASATGRPLRNTTTPMIPARIEPAKIPTFASSAST